MAEAGPDGAGAGVPGVAGAAAGGGLSSSSADEAPGAAVTGAGVGSAGGEAAAGSSAWAGSTSAARASAARIEGVSRIGAADGSPQAGADQAGVRSWLSIPNLLTVARVVAVPFFVRAAWRGDDRTALWLFVAAALTDVADGLLARLLAQRTRLGAVLDPLADKLLTLAAAGVLVWQGRLPAWLLVLVVGRDAGMALGVLLLRGSGRDFVASPVRLGKYATAMLGATMVLALARGGASDPWVATSALLAAGCVGLSAVQYFARWRLLMRAPPPSHRSRSSPPRTRSPGAGTRPAPTPAGPR